jgi:hypothetical protein
MTHKCYDEENKRFYKLISIGYNEYQCLGCYRKVVK